MTYFVRTFLLSFVLLFSVSAQASTTFNFTSSGNRELDGSLTFTSGALSLNVRGFTFDSLTTARLDPDPATLPVSADEINASVGTNSGGLTFRVPGSDISRQDGVGLNELVLFTFSQAVSLTSLNFTDEDNDTFSFFSDLGFDGTTLSGNFIGGPLRTGNGLFTFGGSNVASGTSTTFAVAAILNDSSIQVQALTAVAAVPEPATWLMMVVGFALVGLVRRRRTRMRVLTA